MSNWGRPGCNRMVVGLNLGLYSHWSCDFNSR